jgi:hypothetical protein
MFVSKYNNNDQNFITQNGANYSYICASRVKYDNHARHRSYNLGKKVNETPTKNQ